MFLEDTARSSPMRQESIDIRVTRARVCVQYDQLNCFPLGVVGLLSKSLPCRRVTSSL